LSQAKLYTCFEDLFSGSCMAVHL